MKKNYPRFIEIITIVFSFVALICVFMFIYLVTPVSFEERWQEIHIPDGASYTSGINILMENGLIKSRFLFLLMGRLSMADRDIKTGYYNLSASMSPLQILRHLLQGKTIHYAITIPEGSELRHIRKKFEGTDLLDDESWKLVYDGLFLESLDVDAPSLEGYLYPDTYKFAKGTNPRIIFKIMVQRLRENFNEPLIIRAQEMGMTENEVLTLASIIEKEAMYDSERPTISAVYHNRLKRNMKLQADPTVLYGVKKRWKRIRYRDLRRVTPYNTYVIKGLPPGPIASPGIKSIEAALYPDDVDYIFFVSMNNGRHHFSVTRQEHREAVITYQLNGQEKKK